MAGDAQPAADDQDPKKATIRLPEADARSPSVLAGLLAETPMSLTDLSLAGNGLNGSMFDPFREFLQTRSSLTALDLSGNRYSFLEKVIAMLSTNATLQQLCLREVPYPLLSAESC